MQKKRTVIVTCSLDEGSVNKVAESLRSTAGFEVENVLEMAGSVVGQWEGNVASLRKIPGVIDVSESEEKFAQ